MAADVNPITPQSHTASNPPVTSLAKLDEARRYLAEVRDVDEVKSIRDKAEAMRIYAKEAKLGLEAQNHAAEIKLRAERRAGELLAEMDKHEGGRPVKTADTVSAVTPPTLEQLGISDKQSSRWQGIAAIPEPLFEQTIEAAKEDGKELTTAGLLREVKANRDPHVAYNSGENEWYTPPDYIEAARAVMGGIDLDPASSHEANSCVRAATYYTRHDNGLERPWFGRVWMNPPYSSDRIGKFCARLCDAYRDGQIEQALVLVNNGTETAWFQDVAALASAICFPARRVRFWEPGGAVSQPLQGQAVIYLGDNVSAFRDTFAGFGLVVLVA